MKKFKGGIAIVLICTILVSAFAMSFSASATDTDDKPFFLGDADGDGTITVLDATTIQKSLAQMCTIKEENRNAADADHDYAISVLDAGIIQKWLARYYVPYPIYCSVTMSLLDSLFPRPQPATEEPTSEPTQEPTQEPTEEPTEPPTDPPTDPPTEPPTDPPTEPPTEPFKTMKGIDVSSWNGDIDLQKVKNAGYDFVMIRCGWGDDLTNQDDDQFANTVRKAEAIGMPWGTYLYSYALNLTEAKSEVAHVKRLLKNRKPTLPVAFDMEDADYYKQNHGFPTNTMLINICKTFLSGVESAGYYPILYTNLDYMKYKLNDTSLLNNYDIWYAQWNSECEYPGLPNRLGMWQYGGYVNYIESSTIPGVGTVDKNYMYKDYPSIIKNGGYNNWAVASSGSGYAESGTDEIDGQTFRVITYTPNETDDTRNDAPAVSGNAAGGEISCVTGTPINQINVHTPQNEPD